MEKLRAGLKGDRDKIYTLGCDAKIGLINDADTASDNVIEFFSEKTYDCVLIGAGVKIVSEYTLLI